MSLTMENVSSTYEEIMGLKNTATDNNGDIKIWAIQALSNRLITFRKWLIEEAKVHIHSAVCIVNGEATDGTRNAPVMIVQKPNGKSNFHNNNNAGSGITALENVPVVVDNTALNGRIGTVDGEGDISLYDRTMGCCVRAVRELRTNEVIMTMPRSAMITPDLVAVSDAGRAILACCKLNKNSIENNNNIMGTINNANNNILGFWDAFENTTICESKFNPNIARKSGPQILVKILQDRKKAELAFKKSSKDSSSIANNINISNNINNVELDDEEKLYKLAEYGTISTRAVVLAFLIHQRFYHAARPLVVSNDIGYDDDMDDDNTCENEFQIARDSDDGNALSALDTHGGKMTILPIGAAETYAPYARTLPSSVSLPLCWKRNELALLANCIPGVPLLQEVATTTSQLVAEFIAILDAGITSRFPKTFPEGLLTWDRWVWAAAVFASRNLPVSCYINAGDEKASNFRPTNKIEFQSPAHVWDELGVMVPLLDMLNHEIDEHQVTWQPCIPVNDTSNGESNDAIEESKDDRELPHPPRAIVHKKVKKGCELYCCYGTLSTSNLILQYGFAQVNGNFDEVRLGWALPDAVGNVSPPLDFVPNFKIEPDHVLESNEETSINAWWSEKRIKLLEREAFASADSTFMSNLRAGKKMTVTACSDGTFHPILLAATVIATMPEPQVRSIMETDQDQRVIISRRHQSIIQRYLQFTFSRKLEKLLQNLDNGLKAHFGSINLWTKASEGGIRYFKEQENRGNYKGWQTFFDSLAYKATMEVEKKYYAMGSDSCVLALYDGQLRALQLSVDNVSNDVKFSSGVLQQLRDLGFEVSQEESHVANDSLSTNDDLTGKDISVILENTSTEIKKEITPEESATVINAAYKVSDKNGEKHKENGENSGSKSPRTKKRNRKKASNSEQQKPPAVKLHIGNLSYTTTPSNLYDYFSSIYGQDNVLECHIPVERETSKSRGFGFVAMPEAVANRALQSRQKHEVDGRVLKIAKSNSIGAVSTTKPDEGPPPISSDRCTTCGYRPKYCTCPAPNVVGFNRFATGPIQHSHPPPFGPPFPMEYGREPPRDYQNQNYGGPVERYRDSRSRDYYEIDERLRDYDRDRRSFEYRYEDDHYRGYDRDDDYHREGRRRDRGRDRSREKSPESRTSSRRWDHDDGRGRNKDESRSSRRGRNEGDDSERTRKRSPDRKERSKKKKSKRRARSRSRTPSPK